MLRQCFPPTGADPEKLEEPLKFKVERHRFPGSDGRPLAPDLVGIQPLTIIGERRFDLIERAQELARQQEGGSEDDEKA